MFDCAGESLEVAEMRPSFTKPLKRLLRGDGKPDVNIVVLKLFEWSAVLQGDCVVLSVSKQVSLSGTIPQTYSVRFLKLMSVLITWYRLCCTGWGSTCEHQHEVTRSSPATMRRNPPTQPQNRASPNSHRGTTSGTLSSKKCMTAKWAM